MSARSPRGGTIGRVRARVIVLAGPSGAGKTRLAERSGLPVLRLDDFYRSGGDPALPRIGHGPDADVVDWDDPRSWLLDEAVDAMARLAAEGRAEVPVYDIAHDGRTGSQVLDLGDHHLVVAEGIFAQLVVAPLRERGLLAEAFCVRQHPLVTFWRRLTRDLREHRKPPLTLVRRGWTLMRDQRRIVTDAVAHGCVACTPEEAAERIAELGRRDD